MSPGFRGVASGTRPGEEPGASEGTGENNEPRTSRCGKGYGPAAAPAKRKSGGGAGKTLRVRLAALARVQPQLVQEHVELDRVQLAPAPLGTAQLLLDPHEAVLGMLAHDLADQVLVGEDHLAPLRRRSGSGRRDPGRRRGRRVRGHDRPE